MIVGECSGTRLFSPTVELAIGLLRSLALLQYESELMSAHSALRDLLEPIYKNRPDLKDTLKAAQVRLYRMRTSAWERFPQLIRPDPQHIYLTLTANCNLRCKGCRYGRDFMAGQQLPIELVRDLLEDIKEHNFEVVRLYGGEPLLHKHIATIVEHCTRLNLRTYMTTNGILLKKKVDELFAAGLRRISVGLYGIGEDYNQYVQRKDRFDQLEENLAYVRERYGSQVSMGFGWLLMRPTCSVEAVRETWKFAARYRMPISINLVHYSLPYFTEGDNRELQFTESDRPAIEAVVAEFMRLQKAQPELLPMSPIALRSIPDWLLKGPNMKVPCDRHRLIWVGADGTVQMCYVTFKLGNLHEKRLKEMLFTPQHYDAARDSFALNCPNCHCAYSSRTLSHGPTRQQYSTPQPFEA
jgi:MoaA/NifB/PqqE/SkfB family radical SAM enzyme